MKKAKKLISLLMAAVLCIGMLSGVVLAEDETGADETESRNILALGDSITTGYGLEDADTQCFSVLLAAMAGATVTNRGVNGQTSAELAVDMAAGTYMEEIALADIVTITIGGNDLMAAFYQIVADACNSNAQILAYFQMLGIATPISADDVKAALANPTSTLGQLLLGTLTGTDLSSSLSDSTVFSDAVTSCISNIVAITAAIHAVNADAVVLVANQYNPYQWLGVETIDSLFNTAVVTYNMYLAQYAAVGGYLVADVYTAFSASETTLTNADYAASDFDFHPNAAGHVVIADTMAAVYTAYLAEEEESQAQAELEAQVAAAIEQLSAVIAAAQALDETDYTAESWAVLQAALASAQAVLADLQENGIYTSLTTEEITAAYLALTGAVSSLVEEEESATTADEEEEPSSSTETDTGTFSEADTDTTSEEDTSSTTETVEEDESDTTGTEEENTETEEETPAAATSTDGTDATAATTDDTAAGTGDVSTWIYFVLLIGAATGAVLIARKKEA